LAESLTMAARILAALVKDTDPDARAIIFEGPTPVIAAARDFAPRAGLELILHAHDVCRGLEVPFAPDRELCFRLREHTRPWPIWGILWGDLAASDDPWGDLLQSSGRVR
jgi:hypothetical protein